MLESPKMGFLSSVLVVALMFGFCQDGHAIKPKMSPDNDTLFVDQYEELKIECYSRVARVQFSLPESRPFERRSKHKIHEDGNGTYTLLLERAETSDAGWYACAKEGVKIDNDFRNVIHRDEDIGWIYVYVDARRYPANYVSFVRSHVPNYAKTIISVPGSVVVIPCRPTWPTRNVELWQNLKLVELEEQAVRFDPKIGFIMQHVEFSNEEAIFECKWKVDADQYILRYSGSRPTMITPSSEDLILQEGDALRIECFSESKLSFLYPTILTNASEYEIAEYGNGTSTFLRRSVISDDTGWYGCAAMDIGNNEIPAYSVSYTKKEISWVYVYVNSSAAIISPLVDTIELRRYQTSLLTPDQVVIPCRPTAPESQIRLEVRNGKKWYPQRGNIFDPKEGYQVQLEYEERTDYRCAITKPVRYFSKKYMTADIQPALNQSMKAAILDLDDPLNSDDLIIRITGEDLRMRCDTVAPAGAFYLMEWTVPSTVSASRIKYKHTRSDGRIYLAAFYLRRKSLTMTVANLSETDSGKYICSVRTGATSESTSRTVEVFAEARFLRLGTNYDHTITGRKGEFIRWLVDLKSHPFAEVHAEFSHDQKHYLLQDRIEVKTASKHGAPLLLFEMRNLTLSNRGWYVIYFSVSGQPIWVRFGVDVQEPPTVRLNSTKGVFPTSKMRIDARCRSFGSPEPNITITIGQCPKYPSSENCNLTYGREYDDNSKENGWNICYRQFNISMSGIMTCNACNILGCSNVTEHILFSASNKPYFTSTNLNETEVVLDVATRRSNEPIILECYASGDPYPNVTWFKDAVKLEESRQHEFAYDNRELSILYFSSHDGGRYTCRAKNVHGLVENYIDIRLQGSSDQNNVFLSSVIAGFVTLIVLIVICCVVIYRQHIKASRKKLSDLAFEKGALERFNPELSVVDQAELLPYDLKWEYPRGLLKLDKTLGSGAFGIVKKAEAKSIRRGEAVTTVAVKLVRSTASLNYITALTRELKILAYLGKHPNVVNLLGACTTNVFFGELYVIVEYCRFGNLRDHLLNGRADFLDELRDSSENMDLAKSGQDCGVHTEDSGLNTNVVVGEGSSATQRRCQGTDITGSDDDDGDWDQDSGEAQRLRSKYEGDSTNENVEPISTRDLVYWTWQVSRAMEFLGQRRIVHGDLAARNILLADNGIVKVCDFGLAKALYKEAEYRDTGANPLPIKWMAIESIKDLLFSVQSDVWSYGIVMWEIFSLGETPYPGMRQRGLVQRLIDGYRMERPKYAATTIHNMMQLCWEADPTKRPSFADLSHNLIELLDYDFKTQYLEMHAHYMKMNAEIADNERADYLTLSVDPASSASRMQEQIEMNILTQDVSQSPAV